jgi:hypothetical protein
MSPLLYYFYDLQRDNTTNVLAIGAGTPAPPADVTLEATRYFNYTTFPEAEVVVAEGTRYFNMNFDFPIRAIIHLQYPNLPIPIADAIRHNSYPSLPASMARHSNYTTVSGT